MRVLLANKYFYLKSGAERWLFAVDEALQSHGHETIHLAMRHPQNQPSPWGDYFVSEVAYDQVAPDVATAAAVGRFFYSAEVRTAARRLVGLARPQIAVLNNVYHQLGPALILELARQRVPMVMMLHDYKVVCPSYRLLRAGRPCEKCAGGAFHWAAVHGCGGSTARGVILSLESYWQHRVLRSYERIEQYISPSQFLIDKVGAMGFSRPIQLMRNTVSADETPPDSAQATAIGYAGRLSPEKGVGVLLEAAARAPHIPIRIAGGGPELEGLRRSAASRGLSHVRFLEHLTTEALRDEMATWRAAVVPSIWYENCPYAVLEPLSRGIPVIGSDIGGITELVRDNGLLVPPGDDGALVQAMERLWEAPEMSRTLGQNGLAFVRSECSPASFFTAFEALLQEMIANG